MFPKRERRFTLQKGSPSHSGALDRNGNTVKGYPKSDARRCSVPIDDEEMERLAESVGENGVLVPLTVRAVGPERYELVSGHRRKRAAELAGLESVRCIVETCAANLGGVLEEA